MAGLQRSEISFRRQGSSGLVWDDKVLSGELKKISTKEDEDNNRTAETKSTAASGGGGRAYRTIDVEPAAEPPSPKVSGCGVCSMFGKKKKQAAANSRKRKHGHRNI